jgi:hypothetical protein
MLLEAPPYGWCRKKNVPSCELDLGYNSMAGFCVHRNNLSGFMKAENPFETQTIINILIKTM